jgi:hypothetical protein
MGVCLAKPAVADAAHEELQPALDAKGRLKASKGSPGEVRSIDNADDALTDRTSSPCSTKQPIKAGSNEERDEGQGEDLRNTPTEERASCSLPPINSFKVQRPDTPWVLRKTQDVNEKYFIGEELGKGQVRAGPLDMQERCAWAF